MNPSSHEYDAQRELEQRALLNVSQLAEKLGYQDAIDKRRERWLMIGIGSALVVIVAVLLVSGMRKSGTDADDLVRKRCEVDARVEHTPALRAQIRLEHPDWVGAQGNDLFEQRLRAIAASQCAARQPAQ